jgi:phospholipase/carboxylesterase
MLDGIFIGPASGPARQLVVLCHGIHAKAGQMRGLARALAETLPEAAFALPNAPLRRRAHCLGRFLPRRREWFGIQNPTPAAYEAGARQAADQLDPFIDQALCRLGLPPDAYAMVGFSQGAMTVLFAGLRRTVAPRAIVCFAGSLIGEGSLEQQITHRPPVLIVHGEEDSVVPISASRHAEQTLRRLHVSVTSSYAAKTRHEINRHGIEESQAFLLHHFLI